MRPSWRKTAALLALKRRANTSGKRTGSERAHARSGCVHDLQTQHCLEGIEVVVAVDKLVPGVQTEGGNQTIDGLANGVAARAQVSVVLGSGNSQVTASGLKNLDL